MTALRRRRPGAQPYAAIAALSLVVGLTGCGGGAIGAPQASLPSATPSAASRSVPADEGPIEPGTYRIPRSDWSAVDFTVTFPEGWTVQFGHIYVKNQDTPDELGFNAVVVDEIYTDACSGGAVTEVGPGVGDLAAALSQQQGPTVSGPVDSTIGGHAATRIDLTVPDGFDLAPCNVTDIGLQLWYSRPTDKHIVLLRDSIVSVYTLDVDGQRQVFMTMRPAAASDEDLRDLQAVLDSVRIGM